MTENRLGQLAERAKTLTQVQPKKLTGVKPAPVSGSEDVAIDDQEKSKPEKRRKKLKTNPRKNMTVYMDTGLMKDVNKALKTINRSLPSERDDVSKADFVEALIEVGLKNLTKVKGVLGVNEEE